MITQEQGSAAAHRRPSKLLAIGLTGALLATAATAVALTRTSGTADAAGPEASPPPPTVAAESTDTNAPEKKATLPAPTAKAPHDQLAADEVAYARHLVAEDKSYAATKAVTGDAGAQYLSVNVADPTLYDDQERRLSLMYYDYAAEQVLHYVVNLTDRAVEAVDAAAGVQPAPTELETQTAYDLLLASDVAGEAIAREFTERTGQKTITEEAVDVTAHSLTDGPGLESCKGARCVEVLVQTTEGPFLTTTPYVVNLSDQSVTKAK